MALVRLCPFCFEAQTECICPDSEASATPPASCCNLHGRNCELDDPCCESCTEVRHLHWTDERGNSRFGHPRGEVCSNPVLSPPETGGTST